MWPFIWTNLNSFHQRILYAVFGWNLPIGAGEEDEKCEKGAVRFMTNAKIDEIKISKYTEVFLLHIFNWHLNCKIHQLLDIIFLYKHRTKPLNVARVNRLSWISIINRAQSLFKASVYHVCHFVPICQKDTKRLMHWKNYFKCAKSLEHFSAMTTHLLNILCHTYYI